MLLAPHHHASQQPAAGLGARRCPQPQPRSSLHRLRERPGPAFPLQSPSSQYAAVRWPDAAAQVYYGVECSSKHGKAPKHKHKAHRGRVRSLVAEVERIVERLEQGELDPLAMPMTSPAFTGRMCSRSSSSSSSSSSESDSDDEQRPAAAAAAPRLDAAYFDRQQQQLLERLAAGSLATCATTTTAGPHPPSPSAAAATVTTTSSSNIMPGSPRAGRPALAGRVEVCMGKACARKGAGRVLAEFQAAAAAPGAAGVHMQVVPCGKCMGKCKLAPNVRVTTSAGRSVLHSAVSPANVRAILQGGFAAEADLFDFV